MLVKLRRIFLGSIGLFLVGCNPVKMEAPTTYVLSANVANVKQATGKRTPFTLFISVPKAAPGYDTPRMIYVDRPYELSYFTKNRWADTPARMLTPVFAMAAQATNHFQAVVTIPYVDDADVRLDTELLMLQQDFTQKPSLMRMILIAQLVNVKTRRVLATRQFVFAEKTSKDDPYGGVIATHRIMEKLLPELAEFSVKNTLSSHLREK